MTLTSVRDVLRQAKELGSVKWIYFEGGEPFLFYATLVTAVAEAADLGFRIGLVSNAYWATSREDALACLGPFRGRVESLEISGDLYHGSEVLGVHVRNAVSAASEVGIAASVITIAPPEATAAPSASGQLPSGESAVMFRGRAATTLVDRVRRRPWQEFTECPHEDLSDPGRLHVDPPGYVQVCQGIAIGNLFQEPLREILARYGAETHPIVGPLVAGGPAELARRHGVGTSDGYADACHLCYEARLALRPRFPEQLAPAQMYGVETTDPRLA
jgi:MoaA/NifB/PqqE/SkfB family radical SAM enzyme